jgi:hypothetical protein
MSKEQPPWRPGRGVRVLRIAESDDPYLVLFLGPLYGHREHWTRRDTVPCFGKETECRHHNKFPLRFYAYGAILWQDPRTGKLDPWVLQATASLEEQLRFRNLRGEAWLLRRADLGGRTAEVIGTFVEQRDPSALPAEFRVLPVLERLFQDTGLKLGVSNPNPDRVVPVIDDIEPIVLAELREDVPLKSLSEGQREEAQKRLDQLAEKAGLKPRKAATK